MALAAALTFHLTPADAGVSYEGAAITEAPKKQKTIYKRHWEPWATPSVRQVHIILREEQRRWGGPHLGGRVACESGYRWNATNGQYRGLLQIGSIWGYLSAGMPRDVQYVTEDKRKVRGVIQRLKIVRRGRIPRSATPYHGWAAARAGQRAVSGGPTTGWECGA